MRNLVLLCAVSLLLMAGVASAQFQPVEPTGVTYDVTITNATVFVDPDYVQLEEGDIIGIFDGDLCVGEGVLDAGLFPVTITTYGEDQGEPGFIVGNWINYRIYDAGSMRILNTSPDGAYVQGDGTFGFVDPAEVALTADFNAVVEYYNSVTINSEVFSQQFGRNFGDFGNVAALDVFAADDYDLNLDVPEPAAPTPHYITTYFPHVGWTPLTDNFMYDVRDGNQDLSNDVKVYQFDVLTDIDPLFVNLVFDINGGYDASYGVVLVDTLTEEYQNLREDNTYDYQAADGIPRQFYLRMGDATAPVMSIISPEANDIWIQGQTYDLEWTLDDITKIRYVLLDYSPDNGLNWVRIDSLVGGFNGPVTYPWTIPGEYTPVAKFRVISEDWAGNIDSIETDYTFNLAPTEMSKTFAQYWHLFSLPLRMQTTDVDQLIGDDITGPYYVYDYNGDVNYTRTWDIEYGPGYWLALAEENTLSLVDGTPEVDSSRLDLDEGWNIVGHALPVSLPVDSLWFTDGVEYRTFQDAGQLDPPWISPFLYGYENAQFNYFLADSVHAWGGYWLQVLQQNITMVTYPPTPGVQQVVQADPDVELDDVDNWSVELRVNQGGQLSDGLGRFGVNPEATEGYDHGLDVPTPPTSPTHFVRLLFERPEWGAITGDEFSQDIREPIPTDEPMEFIWPFSIQASRSGPISINVADIHQSLFNLEGYNGEPFEAWIEYTGLNGRGYFVDLRLVDFFTVDYPVAREKMDLLLIVRNDGLGVDGEPVGALPTEFAVSRAYPNPFNPSTVVDVAVPYNTEVTARVFDLLGREIANLDPGQLAAGHHQIVWNAENVAAGVYFLRINTPEGWQSVQKLVFMK